MTPKNLVPAETLINLLYLNKFSVKFLDLHNMNIFFTVSKPVQTETTEDFDENVHPFPS